MSIYCLEDIHISPENKNSFEQDWGGKCVLNSYFSDSRGVAILFNQTLNIQTKEVQKDDLGNLLILNLIFMQHFEFVLVVLYGPNRDIQRFYEDLLFNYYDSPIICCGDWNLVQRYDLDTFGYVRENNKKAREKVLEIISLYDLIDPWREINQDKLKYTWFSSKPPRQMARLDFFLITPDLQPRLVKTDIMHGYRTDHSLIGMSLDVGLVKRGNGYWKMNTSLLYDVEYIQLVKNEIKIL